MENKLEKKKGDKNSAIDQNNEKQLNKIISASQHYSGPLPPASELKKYSEVYPDMKLYEEIIFLQHFAKCKWVVENVISYYDPLVKPKKFDRHYFWSNFPILKLRTEYGGDIRKGHAKELQEVKGINIDNYNL